MIKPHQYTKLKLMKYSGPLRKSKTQLMVESKCTTSNNDSFFKLQNISKFPARSQQCVPTHILRRGQHGDCRENRRNNLLILNQDMGALDEGEKKTPNIQNPSLRAIM